MSSKVRSVHKNSKRTKTLYDDRVLTYTYSDHEIIYKDGHSGGYVREESVVDYIDDRRTPPPKERLSGRRVSRSIGARASNLYGFIALGASAFVGIFFYILLMRAYNHLPYLGVYDLLHLLAPGSATQMPEWFNIGWSYLDGALGTLKVSFTRLLPEKWSGIATVLDYTTNAPFILISALQVILEFLRMAMQLINLVYQFGNFVTSVITTGTGWGAGNATRQALRDSIWQNLAGV